VLVRAGWRSVSNAFRQSSVSRSPCVLDSTGGREIVGHIVTSPVTTFESADGPGDS
jgi:hypothetical protein